MSSARRAVLSTLAAIVAAASCARPPDRVRVAIASGEPGESRLPPASTAPVTQISVGPRHACARHADGTASCWGDNVTGAIGTSDTSRVAPPRRAVTGELPVYGSAEPTPVMAPVRDVRAIAAGRDRTCALRADGVWCWGGGDPEPAHVSGTEEVVELGADCGRRADGAVVCWGELVAADPVIDRATALASAERTACALRIGGSVWCWRADGTTGYSVESLVSLGGLDADDVVQVALGLPRQACRRRATGAVECIVDDRYGHHRGEPVPVGNLERAIAVAAGPRVGCAIQIDRSVRCWELSPYPSGTAYLVAAPIAGLVADEIGVGDGYACARTAGDVVCWGDDTVGQLGRGTYAIQVEPTDVAGIDDAVEVFAGGGFTCARRRTGDMACWGALGDSTTPTPTPEVVPALRDALQVMGDAEMCAHFPSGRLGCGTPGTGFAVHSVDVERIAMTRSHVVTAQREAKLVRTDELPWSERFNVALPDVSSAAPEVAEIAAAPGSTCIIRADRSTWCAGLVMHPGESRFARSMPVAGAEGARGIAIAGESACIIDRDERVRCWGSGRGGVLGAVAVGASAVVHAIPVTGLAEVVAIRGGTAMCALRRGGALACWGDNRTGQLGAEPASAPYAALPRFVLDDVVGFAMNEHVCAVRGSGKVTCWGQTDRGQAGSRVGARSATPAPVRFHE
jgi:alpha-tubulin suppressor-like RCC1 family protein